MKKNTTISFLILLSIIVSSNISAEEANTATTSIPTPPVNAVVNTKTKADIGVMRENRMAARADARVGIQASTTEVRKMREENKAEIKKIRADFQTELKTNKASSTVLLKEKRHALIEGIQAKRDLFKEEIGLKKDAIASTSAAIKLKFKADLEKIKDEKKKIKVANIGENLLELNVNLTGKATEKVNKIEEVLIAIESRTDKATAAGANLVNVRALISMAETAIADARAAIVLQTAKTYVVTIQSEATVKTSAQTTRNLLKSDIEAMRVKIKAAHEATRKAANALKANPKARTTTTATTTATSTATTTAVAATTTATTTSTTTLTN